MTNRKKKSVFFAVTMACGMLMAAGNSSVQAQTLITPPPPTTPNPLLPDGWEEGDVFNFDPETGIEDQKPLSLTGIDCKLACEGSCAWIILRKVRRGCYVLCMAACLLVENESP